MLDRLLAGADVLVESLDPAERDALDLRPTQTTARFPALVHASITGFGVSGPKADWRCSDLVAMAAGGYLVLTGDEDRPPVRISLDQAYHHAAADAAGAVLIALRERHRSGRGQHIDAAAQASLVEATQSFVLAAPYGAPLIKRVSGGTKLPPFTLRLIHPCLDGYVTTVVLFGPSIGPFTQRLMAWICEEGGCDRQLARQGLDPVRHERHGGHRDDRDVRRGQRHRLRLHRREDQGRAARRPRWTGGC